MDDPKILSKDAIKSYTTERDFLAGLSYNPEAIYEVSYLEGNDFHSDVNHKLFTIFQHLLVREDVKKLDAALLLSEISRKAYVFPPQCNISDYITKLIRQGKDVSHDTTIMLGKAIKLYSARRDLFNTCSEIQKKISLPNEFDNLSTIITATDEIYFDCIHNFIGTEDMYILGNGITADLNYRADHPVDHIGFSTGFKFYDELIGHLRPDSFNFVSARGKAGKSIMAVNIATHVAKNEKFPVFYADSEMTADDIRVRFISHLAQVNFELIETGRWKQNKEICTRVEQASQIFETLPVIFFSMRASNVAQMISAARRFLFRYVKRTTDQKWNPCLLLWDYIKLDYYDSGTSDNPWYNIAKSVVHFKDFLGKVESAAMVFGQSNRSGIARKDKDGKFSNEDNESTVAGSDEIIKSATNVSQLRWKTADEIKRDGVENGDFSLIPFVARKGRGGSWVQVSEGVIEREYVCLKRRALENTFHEITTNRLILEKKDISNAVGPNSGRQPAN